MISLKSAREIEIMRRANIIVAEVLQALKERVAPGVTTLDLDAVAEELTLKKKAIPAFKGYNVAGRVYPRCLCASINDEIVHGIPSNRALREGDIIGLDYGVIYEGFYGDSAITVGVGRVNEAAQQSDECYGGVAAPRDRGAARRKAAGRSRCCRATGRRERRLCRRTGFRRTWNRQKIARGTAGAELRRAGPRPSFKRRNGAGDRADGHRRRL